ncbi:MAG: Tex-like N-terminal domain-containing protein, partial [Bradymonadaceae bacterium]
MEKRIAKELGLKVAQVSGTLGLLDEGNTVPFIARYRKERTGNLDEVQIRDVAKLSEQIRQLEERRETILNSIAEQGKLTADLRRRIEETEEPARLEDLYAPYRPRRMTRAKKAIEAGLEPVAEAIKNGKDYQDLARNLTSEDFPTVDDVLGGARDIIAEEIADDAVVRDYVRTQTRRRGKLSSKKRRGGQEDPKYQMYLEFTAPLGRLKPHQTLAIRRGEQEKVLSAGVEVDDKALTSWIKKERNRTRGGGRRLVDEAIEDGYKRLLHPAVERDIRGELEAVADAHAIGVFSLNLKNLLLQPPLSGRRVLGIDPGMRTGCKMTAVDATGQLLGQDQIFIHDGRKNEAPHKIRAMAEKYRVDII